MNSLPASWSTARLEDIAELNPRHHEGGPDDDTMVSFLPMSAIEAETTRICLELTRPWSAVKKAYTSFRDGDVLFAKITPCMENGKMAVCSGLHNGFGAGSTEFHVARPNPSVLDGKYLLYYLLQKQVRQEARLVMQGGVGHLRVPANFLAELKLPISPRHEQHRIVAEIEKQFTLLDAGVKAIQIGLSRLARLRSALLERVFSEFRNTMVPLGDIADVQGGIQKQPKRRPLTNHYPFLRVANVLRGRLTLSDIHEIELFRGELDRLRLEKGDLLIVEGNGSPGEIGRMAIWDGSIPDCVHQNHIIRARLRPGVTPQFLAAYWNSPKGAQAVRSVASSTSGLHTLSVSKVKAIPCPLASEDQQASVIDKLEQVSTVSDVLHASLQAAALRARRLRQSILAKAFSGQLVPQNPTDEPASMLLDRIREQRAKIVISTTRQHAAGNQL